MIEFSQFQYNLPLFSDENTIQYKNVSIHYAHFYIYDSKFE